MLSEGRLGLSGSMLVKLCSCLRTGSLLQIAGVGDFTVCIFYQIPNNSLGVGYKDYHWLALYGEVAVLVIFTSLWVKSGLCCFEVRNLAWCYWLAGVKPGQLVRHCGSLMGCKIDSLFESLYSYVRRILIGRN